MTDVDVLYLKKNNRSTDIVYLHSNKTINSTIDKIINNWCIERLTTLTGRCEAIEATYNIHQFIPIYIDSDLILLPIYQKKYYTQIYINIVNVKELLKLDTQTRIVFVNNQNLIVDAPYLRIKQYLEKCIQIKNDQLIKMQERIYKSWQRKI